MGPVVSTIARDLRISKGTEKNTDMKFLFVHQNMPGQYREMVRWLVQQGGHDIVFLTQRSDIQIDGVTTRSYTPFQTAGSETFGLARTWEEAAGAGYGAALSAQALKADDGFSPDIIVGHTGWGELTFLKEVWPDVPIIGYFEYFYRNTGGLVGFDPEEPVSKDAGYFSHARNVVPYANLDAVDLGQCPTFWQRDRFPEYFHEKMYTCHDGIRTDLLKPDPNVSLNLTRLPQPLTREDEIVTYMARNMERSRGFHIMMRSLPSLLEARPNARVILIGGNETSYGRKSDDPGGLRGEMEKELGNSVDWSRVHFVGRVPYSGFQKLIQLSRCHIYLTMPFVLSWSLLESMSMQATIVASDVAPVREAITHEKTGLLVDFFKPEALAQQVADVLESPQAYANLGPAARAHVIQKYDFLTHCLPEHIARINSLLPKAQLRGPR
jgi:glycosyltransferase involved in cell wall biosynthesis